MHVLRKALNEKIDELDDDKTDWPSRSLFQAYQFCHDKDLSDTVVTEIVNALDFMSTVTTSEEKTILAERIIMALRAVAS